ncbi:hypothetical protein HPB47_019150, partial [Ixodes persulcatus]
RSPRNRHCCVPRCKTGYRSAERKSALFSVPKDSERFLLWSRSIPCGDAPLQPSWAVCELHFDERFVQHFYEPHIIKGEIVQLKRERPALTQDAHPTVFPNLPSYLTKKLPRKRKERSESSDVHANVGRLKCARCDASLASSPNDIEEDEELRSEKLLLVRTQAAELESHKTQCLLYVKRKKLKEVDRASVEDLNQELEAADSIQTCCGAGLLYEFLPLEVCKEPIAAAYRVDSHVLPVRVMLRITHSTLYSNAFEKMRVNLTSRLFSDEVLRGLDLHHKTVEQNCGSYSATVKFVCLINKLIQVMTSRCPDDALRPQTSEATFIDDFLSFLTDWEEKAEDGGFVSKATAEGLRVTLESTKGILAYLGHLNYEFLMTARLSQDCIERLFGIIRQSNGANDYPTPTQFLLTVNCLSFYNLARSPQEERITDIIQASDES